MHVKGTRVIVHAMKGSDILHSLVHPLINQERVSPAFCALCVAELTKFVLSIR